MRKTQSDSDLPNRVADDGVTGPAASASSDVLATEGVQLLKGSGSNRGSVLINFFERSPSSQVGLGKVSKAHWKVGFLIHFCVEFISFLRRILALSSCRIYDLSLSSSCPFSLSFSLPLFLLSISYSFFFLLSSFFLFWVEQNFKFGGIFPFFFFFYFPHVSLRMIKKNNNLCVSFWEACL